MFTLSILVATFIAVVTLVSFWIGYTSVTAGSPTQRGWIEIDFRELSPLKVFWFAWVGVIFGCIVAIPIIAALNRVGETVWGQPHGNTIFYGTYLGLATAYLISYFGVLIGASRKKRKIMNDTRTLRGAINQIAMAIKKELRAELDLYEIMEGSSALIRKAQVIGDRLVQFGLIGQNKLRASLTSEDPIKALEEAIHDRLEQLTDGKNIHELLSNYDLVRRALRDVKQLKILYM